MLRFDDGNLRDSGWFGDAWLHAVIAEAPVNFNRGL